MIGALHGAGTAGGGRALEGDPRLDETLFAAAQPGAVFSTPVTAGGVTLITASEVIAFGGYGGGSSVEEAGERRGGGSGGGGASRGRPIAAIVISPDGVHVQPIFDVTKISMALVGAGASLAVMWLRATRKRP